MKKRKAFLAPFFHLTLIAGGISLVATSCQKAVTVKYLTFGDDLKVDYNYGETFVKPSIIAHFTDGSSYDVKDECTFDGFNSYKVGDQVVTVTYLNKTLTYNVTVSNDFCELLVVGQKTSFEVGDAFTLGGTVYLVRYSGDKASISEAKYTVEHEGTGTTGEFTATVIDTVYHFTFSYTYNVVAASTFTPASIAFSDIIEEYEVGDTFVRPTAIVTDTSDNTHDVSDFVTYSGFESSIARTITITGKYKTVSNTFQVTIKPVDEGGTTSVDIPEDTISAAFKLKNNTDNTTISPDENGVYLIDGSQALNEDGVIDVTASGKLAKGQIKVNATKADEEDPTKLVGLDVELTLNKVSIHNDEACPIHVVSCGDIDISAKKDSANYLYDDRTTAVVDEENDQYGGAIYVEDGDLKLKGKGQLKLVSYSNNGIHAKDDVTIKNLGLVINAVNNGVKGNDSVTFEEKPKVKIECGNDGIKTSSTDLNKSGEQRGNISIFGGEIEIQSYGDAIDAAYDLIISESVDKDDPTVTYKPVLDIYTYTFSTFKPANYGVSASFYNDNSKKGLKSTHDLAISGGELFIKAYDDAIHGNKTTDNTQIVYETGAKAVGDVTISGGELEIYTNDDGIHADSTLTVSGGKINVTQSFEGLEGHIVNISGGESYVKANDDGVNAPSTSNQAKDGQINVSGGYLDVTVPASGDVDGIDSNGTYTQTGGIVIVRGPANGGSWSLDTDSTVTLNGGTIVVVGGIEASSSGGHGGWPAPGGGGPGGSSATLVVGSNMKNITSSTGKGIGTFRVTAGTTINFTYQNIYSYSGSVIIYSDAGTPSIANA